MRTAVAVPTIRDVPEARSVGGAEDEDVAVETISRGTSN